MNKTVLLWLIIILAIALAHLNHIEKRKHFVCPNCGHSFKASKYKLLLAPHFLLSRRLKCPACKRRSFMRPVND